MRKKRKIKLSKLLPKVILNSAKISEKGFTLIIELIYIVDQLIMIAICVFGVIQLFTTQGLLWGLVGICIPVISLIWGFLSLPKSLVISLLIMHLILLIVFILLKKID